MSLSSESSFDLALLQFIANADDGFQARVKTYLDAYNKVKKAASIECDVEEIKLYKQQTKDAVDAAAAGLTAAKSEAAELISSAKITAKEIVSDAKAKAAEIINKASVAQAEAERIRDQAATDKVQQDADAQASLAAANQAKAEAEALKAVYESAQAVAVAAQAEADSVKQKLSKKLAAMTALAQE